MWMAIVEEFDTATPPPPIALPSPTPSMRQKGSPRRLDSTASLSSLSSSSPIKKRQSDSDKPDDADDANAKARRAEIRRIQGELKRAQRVRQLALDSIDEPDDHVYVLSIDTASGGSHGALAWKNLGRAPEDEIYRIIWDDAYDSEFVGGSDDTDEPCIEYDAYSLSATCVSLEDGNVVADEDADYDSSYRVFGPIDPEFIHFMRLDFIDYDDRKHRDFYAVSAKQMREYARRKLEEVMTTASIH